MGKRSEESKKRANRVRSKPVALKNTHDPLNPVIAGGSHVTVPEFDPSKITLPSDLGGGYDIDTQEREAILAKIREQGADYWQDDKRLNTWTPGAIRACLNAITAFGIMQRGAQAAGMSYAGLVKFMKQDVVMRAAVDEARAQHRAFVEELVFVRGVKGWLEPVISKGHIVRDHEGKVVYSHKYDQKICEMYVKRFAPEYKEKSEIDLNVRDAGVLAVDGMQESEEAFDAEYSDVTYEEVQGGAAPVIDAQEEKTGHFSNVKRG